MDLSTQSMLPDLYLHFIWDGDECCVRETRYWEALTGPGPQYRAHVYVGSTSVREPDGRIIKRPIWNFSYPAVVGDIKHGLVSEAIHRTHRDQEFGAHGPVYKLTPAQAQILDVMRPRPMCKHNALGLQAWLEYEPTAAELESWKKEYGRVDAHGNFVFKSVPYADVHVDIYAHARHNKWSKRVVDDSGNKSPRPGSDFSKVIGFPKWTSKPINNPFDDTYLVLVAQQMDRQLLWARDHQHIGNIESTIPRCPHSVYAPNGEVCYCVLCVPGTRVPVPVREDKEYVDTFSDGNRVSDHDDLSRAMGLVSEVYFSNPSTEVNHDTIKELNDFRKYLVIKFGPQLKGLGISWAEMTPKEYERIRSHPAVESLVLEWRRGPGWKALENKVHVIHGGSQGNDNTKHKQFERENAREAKTLKLAESGDPVFVEAYKQYIEKYRRGQDIVPGGWFETIPGGWFVAIKFLKKAPTLYRLDCPWSWSAESIPAEVEAAFSVLKQEKLDEAVRQARIRAKGKNAIEIAVAHASQRVADAFDFVTTFYLLPTLEPVPETDPTNPAPIQEVSA